MKLLRVLPGLEPGQVGEDGRLDGLEQLKRRPDDQHHVEHEAGDADGQRRAGAGLGRHDQHPGVHQGLLGEHDPHHRDGKPTAVAERKVGGGFLHLAVGGTLSGRVGHLDPGRRSHAHP